MSIKIRDAAGNEVEVAGGGGSSPDAVTVPGGAIIEMGEGIGDGSFAIKFTPEEDSPELGASEVGYDNASSGLEATTVQGAVDEVAAAVEAVRAKQEAGTVYSTEEVLVGTWIDGKPLYRRVWKFSLSMTKPYEQYIQIDPDFLGVEPIRFSGNVTMLWPGATHKSYYPLACSEIKQNYNSGWCSSAYYEPNGGLMMLYSFGEWPSASNVYHGDFTVIVEYTKTTDEEEA